MEFSLRELRFFEAVARAGSFTDAALELGVSQAAVSRMVAALEQKVGGRLLDRLPHGAEANARGRELLPRVRRLLADAEALGDLVGSSRGVLRVGYAWSAVGVHTAPLLRRWAVEHPNLELRLVKHHSPSAGLAEGVCDAAIVRVEPDAERFESVTVGAERRLAVFSADDPAWGRRRSLSMAEIARRPIVADPRTGTTRSELWPADSRPDIVPELGDTDAWLDAIAAGRGVGITAEATASHHPRVGIVYRRIADAPRVPVRLAWRRRDRPAGVDDLTDLLTDLYAEA